MPLIKTRPLLEADWPAVSKIYGEGIETKIATFETTVPSWDKWNTKYSPKCRLVAEIKDKVIGFIVLSKVSDRDVYKGVAEVSLYISKAYWGQQVGQTLLNELINKSEKEGFWTLQANIFSQNQASINLFLKCGFRIIGTREKIGKRNNKWFDNQLLERRSEII